MAFELTLDDQHELRTVTGRSEDLRLEREDPDHWFLRVGTPGAETLVVHFQTILGSPEIRAFYAKEHPRR